YNGSTRGRTMTSMALEQIPTISPITISALNEISAAIARSRSAATIVDELSRLLAEFRLARAVRIEFESHSSTKSPVSGLHGYEATRVDDLGSLHIPIPSAINALTLTALVFDGPSPDAVEIAPAITAQVGAALDRAYLEERVLELKSQADRRINEVSTIYEIGRTMD